MAASSFFYAALQLCLGTYLVTYLTGQLDQKVEDKANELGVKIIDEAELKKLLG